MWAGHSKPAATSGMLTNRPRADPVAQTPGHGDAISNFVKRGLKCCSRLFVLQGVISAGTLSFVHLPVRHKVSFMCDE